MGTCYQVNIMRKTTLFDFLNQIYMKKSGLKYDKKIAPAYMLSLWLSHDIYLINLFHKLCFLQFTLPDKAIYDYYFDKIPKGRRYIKWVKKTPEEKQKLKEIQEMQKLYNLSKREAKMTLKYMEKIK